MISIYDSYLENNKDLIDAISNISEGKKPKLGPNQVLVGKGRKEEAIDVDDLRDYLKKGWELHEATLTKNQQDMVKDIVDNELDLEEFEKKYGKKEGKGVAFAVATNMVKKKEGITDEELNEVDYEYDGKVVKISKKNFSKVHKDYKNSTKGKERMMISNPKSGGVISVPVQFEEVELDEAPAEVWHLANKKFNLISDKDEYILVSQGSGKEKKLKAKTPRDATAELVKLGYKESVQFEEVELDEKKSATDYEIYHKSFSAAMQHAYEYAEKKGYIVDPNEIDSKVALGPRKPSVGKTNRYDLKAGRKTAHIQVYNMNNKTYELNMYIEEVQHEDSHDIELEELDEVVEVDGRKKGYKEAIKRIVDRQNRLKEKKDNEMKVHNLGDSHWEASDELVNYLRNLTPGENPETELDEDAKMAKKSDDALMSMLHQMLGQDQSRPTTQHQLKRIRKELKKRGLKEASNELDEAHGKNIDHLRDIISGKKANTLKFSDGTMKVDLFSASGIVQVYDKVNKMNQDKLDKMVNGSKKDFIKAQDIAFKLINKSKK